MNEDTRGTIDFCENRLKENLLTCLLVLLYLWELYIYGKSLRKFGSWCHNVNHFHLVWFIFTNIQIFSLIHCYYHLSTTQVPNLSGQKFNTPAVLFNTSDSVVVLWVAVMLARINKRKWSLKKRTNQAKLNAILEDFSFKKFVYIQGLPPLSQPFFPNKPHMQTFLTLQPKWTPEEELCLNNNSAFRSRNQQSSELFELL